MIANIGANRDGNDSLNPDIRHFAYCKVGMDTIAAYRRSRPHFDDAPPSASRPLLHSTASLGPAFRSRSLDHRRFPNFDTETRGISRTFYASKPAGGGGRTYAPSPAYHYKSELFGNGSKKDELHPQLTLSSSDAYRSNSVERTTGGGVTVVPIRRESTLPTRRSEWKSLRPIGSPVEDNKKECEEYTSFDRATRYNHQRKVWPPPRGNFGYGRKSERLEVTSEPRSRRVTSNVYYPDSATADYSSRMSHQTGSDRHHRWHSGATHKEREHYGTFNARRSGMEQQHYERDGEGGAVHHQRFREEEKDRCKTGGGDRRHEYANGWGGAGSAQQYAERGYGGHFEDDRTKSRGPLSGTHWSSSHRLPQDHDSSKHYRKIRCCCFNLIWPPWAIVPSGPPKSMYGNRSAQNQHTYERDVPIELRTFDDRRELFDKNGTVGEVPYNNRMSPPVGRHGSFENHRKPKHFHGVGPAPEATGPRHQPPAEESPPDRWGPRRGRESGMNG
uniref:Uncharacterized protein n=1 Tax=Globodera rostochiensis TaxID=31243 RepID=A0A914HDV9_GLORO